MEVDFKGGESVNDENISIGDVFDGSICGCYR